MKTLICKTCGNEFVSRHKNAKYCSRICAANGRWKNTKKEDRKSVYEYWVIKYGKEIADQKMAAYSKKQSDSNSGEKNSMHGKTVYDTWVNKYGKDEADKRLSMQKKERSNNMMGDKNFMYKKSFYSVWLNKYGETIANQKMKEFKEKQSILNSGEQNPMYGKPSPSGSGNGWSGWYRGKYFRSLLELSYMHTNLLYESAEQKKFRIPYIINGVSRTYMADFIVDDLMIEIKPKKLWASFGNSVKFEAAHEWCKNNNMKFIVIEPEKLSLEIIIYLYKSGDLKFIDRYDKKFKERYLSNYENFHD